MRAALDRDLPVLAICRGSQVLNVVLGGGIEQHVPDRACTDVHKETPASSPTRRRSESGHPLAASRERGRAT